VKKNKLYRFYDLSDENTKRRKRDIQKLGLRSHPYFTDRHSNWTRNSYWN